MTQNTDFATPVTPPPGNQRPALRRDSSDRVLGGVASGVARWLEIDPVIVRVVLVILAVFGGSGLVLYAIGWLFIPSDDASATEADRLLERVRQPRSTARTVLLVIGAVIGIIILANVTGALFGHWADGGSFLLLAVVAVVVVYLLRRRTDGVPPAPAGTVSPETVTPAPSGSLAEQDVSQLPPPTTVAYAYGGSGAYPGYVAPQPAPVPKPRKPARPRSYLGLATFSISLAVVGVLAALTITGAANVPVVVIFGSALAVLGLGLLVGSFLGRARWLVALAIPLTLVTALSALIPSDFTHNVGTSAGNVTWHPTSVQQASTPYVLGVGTANLDLTTMNIPAATTAVNIDATVGLGRLQVTVPAHMRVAMSASVGVGRIFIFGQLAPGARNVAYRVRYAGPLPLGPTTGPIVYLHLRTSIGDLEVSRA